MSIPAKSSPPPETAQAGAAVKVRHAAAAVDTRGSIQEEDDGDSCILLVAVALSESCCWDLPLDDLPSRLEALAAGLGTTGAKVFTRDGMKRRAVILMMR
jgi:hypothetical protein